jgi:hypothetical protein
MPGTRKARWCAVTCPACGNEATLELVRRHNLARRLKCRCGTRRQARVQWIVGPPRRKPSWMKPRMIHPKLDASTPAPAIDPALDDRLDDLFRDEPTK